MKYFGEASKDMTLKEKHKEWTAKAFADSDKDKDNRHNLKEFIAYNKLNEANQVEKFGSAITFTDAECETLFKIYSKVFGSALGLTEKNYS